MRPHLARFRGPSMLLALGLLVAAWPPGPASPVGAQELPTIPPPVAVAVDPASTALLMLDFNTAVCAPTPACQATLPAAAAMLAAARRANVFVVHSNTTQPGATPLPDVAPLPAEPIVMSSAYKFYNTDLEDILASRGITTAVVLGFAANGAVLYTSFGANQRGVTVVVAEDAISAAQDFFVFLTRHQLLNQPGFSNPQNEPLRERAVTLSRTNLITFR